MSSLEANIRNNSTKGQLNAIRNNGNVPAIIYGGKDENKNKLSDFQVLNNGCLETFKGENSINKLLARYHHTTTRISGSKFLVYGGFGNTGSMMLIKLEDLVL